MISFRQESVHLATRSSRPFPLTLAVFQGKTRPRRYPRVVGKVGRPNCEDRGNDMELG